MRRLNAPIVSGPESVGRSSVLERLIGLSLRHRGIVCALAVLLAGYGLHVLGRARLDVFPEFAPPTSLVQTEAEGLTSEQVETLVTQPIEDALGGLSGLRTMRSKSFQGLSAISVVFADGTNVMQARQLVAERLAGLAGTLPDGAGSPRLLPLTTATSVVRTIGLTSTSRSLAELHDVARWTLRPQLLGVTGVADAIVFGGETLEVQVRVHPDRLLRHGLSMQDVIDATRASTGVRGAGFVENANQRIAIDLDGQASTPEALARTVLRRSDGAVLTLGDVAEVVRAPGPAVGAASILARPGVMLVLESQYGSDTLSVTRGIDGTLEALAPVLAREGIELHADVFRPAAFILASIDHLRTALLVGAVLVVAVLFLFLLDVRSALISAVAIPLSLLTAIIVLDAFGASLNVMVLGGLAIALGEVVDDAIVDVENIHRRLRLNRALATPLPALHVVHRASLEVRGSVVYATLAVILLFLPLVAMTGVGGKLVAPLGIAYILAVLASLGVALTLTPAMALALLARDAVPASEPRLVAGAKRRYAALLVRVEARAGALRTSVVVACLLALGALPLLSGNFIPALREGHYLVHLGIAPGASLGESMRLGTAMSRTLMDIPGVRLVAQRAGRADEVVDPMGVQLSELEVDLDPTDAAGQDAILGRIETVLAGFPGATTAVNTFLVERIDETISGSTAPFSVEVFGEDLDVIDRTAQDIARVLATIRGAASVRVESPPGIPELAVRLDPDRLARHGLRAGDVLDAASSALQGITVAQVHEGVRTSDVRVILDPAARERPENVAAVPLQGPDGVVVTLGEVADLAQVAGRYQIAHDGGRRLQRVSVDLGSRSASDFAAEARARVEAEIVLPPGTYTVFAGEDRARAQSRRDLLVYGAMAMVGIVLSLLVALGSARAVALVLANLPFALVGGVAAVLLTGADLSLGAMVGFVTLFGISLRNSIMLITHFERLVEVEGLAWNLDAAVRGASERLVPILMTALATGLALLPLAVTSGAAGNEIEGPMAIVVLGGLITSTVLNLVVLPTLALRYGRFGRKDDMIVTPFAATARPRLPPAE